jgi:hypothetical protein
MYPAPLSVGIAPIERAPRMAKLTGPRMPSLVQTAASIAGLMITTEAMVAELLKKEGPMSGGGMGGMM